MGALSQGRGVQFGELTREGHVPKSSASVQSRYIALSAEGFSPYRGSERPLPGLIYRPLLSESFSGVTNSTVWAPKDKEKPPTTFDSSHLQIIYYKFEVLLIYINTYFAHPWTNTAPLQATQFFYKVPSKLEPKTSCKDAAEWSEHLQWTKQDNLTINWILSPELCLLPASCWYFGLLFNAEVGGDMLVGNGWFSSDNMALYSRRLTSS
jgi:hypothetical protein